MLKRLLILLIFAMPLMAQTDLNPSAPTSLAVAPNLPVFSPAPGTYSSASPPNVSITCPIGTTSAMYTTDLEPPTIASSMWASPIATISTTTYTAMCATVGAYQTNTQNSSTGTNCFTAAGGTWGSTTCSSSGGVVGTPTNVTFTIPGGGSPAFESLTTPTTSSSQTQALFVFQYAGSLDPSAPRCDLCTEEAQDITIAPTVGSSIILENEFDNPQYDYTHGLNRQHGYQCNQQSGKDIIQVDSGHSSTVGGWTDSTVPCNFAANTKYHLVTHNHWFIGDTGCYGGNGCDYYDFIGINGTYYTLNGDYSGSQGFARQSGYKAWGRQDQIGLASTSGTAITGGRNVYSATVALGYGDESPTVTATYTIVSSVATPTLSVASGPVAPGTTVTPSDSTPGAVVAYTTDGTTPGCQSYPAGSATLITGTGTTMIYHHQYTLLNGTVVTLPDPAIYGPLTIKAIGCLNGFTPSGVATYSYTLTAPTGTGISACTASLSGTNYLTADVSSAGTCMGVTAANTTLNLNGHTLTYGTASGVVMSGTGMTLTSGSTTATCSTCSFTSAINGLKIFADNYNTGGYQNMADTTTVTYVSPTQITMSTSPAFTTSNAEWFIASAPVYGVACDPSVYGTCTALKVYNGTITQGNVLDAPGSNVIEVNPHAYGGANGPFVIAHLTANYSAPETKFFYENDSSGQDLIENNLLNIAVTQIYYRDGLQYPIKFDNGGNTPTTPAKLVIGNQILNSPQGGILCSWACYAWNNYVNNTTSVQYANGYSQFAGNGVSGQGASGSLFLGNTDLGASRGIEIEQGGITVAQNQVNLEDSGSVQDPNHNPTGCEIDGGYDVRTKDFSSGLNNIPTELIDSNLLTMTTGPCGGQVLRFTAIGSSDAGTSSNNNYNLIANTTNGPSSFDSIDGAVMSGFTYSNQTYNLSGADASSVYNAYVWYDQGTLWSVPNLVSPKVLWRQGASGSNSSASFTGTGTATCTKIANSGSTSAMTLTFNGASVPCL